MAAVALMGLGFASGASAKTEKAIVAGGCFWSVESDFEPVAGVIDVVKSANAAIAEAEAVLGAAVVTPVLPAGKFWMAEDYHQDYYKRTNLILTRVGPKKQSHADKFYREACGRDTRVRGG